MNNYQQPQPAILATAEQLNINQRPPNAFEMHFYAQRRAHYKGMQPNDKKHERFIKQQLKDLDNVQKKNVGYTKIN